MTIEEAHLKLLNQSSTRAEVTKYAESTYIVTIHNILIGKVTGAFAATFDNLTRVYEFLETIGIEGFNYVDQTTITRTRMFK